MTFIERTLLLTTLLFYIVNNAFWEKQNNVD